MSMNGYVDNRGFIPKSRADLRSKVDLSKTYSQKKKEKTKRKLGKLRRNDTDFRKEYKMKGGGKIPRKNKPIVNDDQGYVHILPRTDGNSLHKSSHHGFSTKDFKSNGWNVSTDSAYVMSHEGHNHRYHETRQHLLSKGYWLNDYGGISKLDPFKEYLAFHERRKKEFLRERRRNDAIVAAQFDLDRMSSLLKNQMQHQQRLDRKR